MKNFLYQERLLACMGDALEMLIEEVPPTSATLFEQLSEEIKTYSSALAYAIYNYLNEVRLGLSSRVVPELNEYLAVLNDIREKGLKSLDEASVGNNRNSAAWLGADMFLKIIEIYSKLPDEVRDDSSITPLRTEFNKLASSETTHRMASLQMIAFVDQPVYK
jgi:hypothetical protein